MVRGTPLTNSSITPGRLLKTSSTKRSHPELDVGGFCNGQQIRLHVSRRFSAVSALIQFFLLSSSIFHRRQRSKQDKQGSDVSGKQAALNICYRPVTPAVTPLINTQHDKLKDAFDSFAFLHKQSDKFSHPPSFPCVVGPTERERQRVKDRDGFAQHLLLSITQIAISPGYNCRHHIPPSQLAIPFRHPLWIPSPSITTSSNE